MIDRVVLHDATYTTLLLAHLEAQQPCDALLLGARQCSITELSHPARIHGAVLV
jgi:hypothetical protein